MLLRSFDDRWSVVGAIQEERLSLRKNQVAFPRQAASRLVVNHLEGADEVDVVVFGGKQSDPYYAALDRFCSFTVHDHVHEQHELWRPYFYEGKRETSNYWLTQLKEKRHLNVDSNFDFSWLPEMDHAGAISHFSEIERREAVFRNLQIRPAISFVDHHTSHAHYAFFGAPLTARQKEEALILTADGWGDGANWSASTWSAPNQLKEIARGTEHKVARIYKWATLLLGMKPNEHEYKVMGLSAYSKAKRHIEAAQAVFYDALDFRNGQFVSDNPLVDSYFDLGRRLEGHRFDIVAAALQIWSTDLTKRWMEFWLEQTGKRGLCFSGGLSMNIKTNGDLLRSPSLDWISVPGSGGDESLSIGACFAYAASVGVGEIEHCAHLYLGDRPEQLSQRWEEGILRAGQLPASYRLVTECSPSTVARLLANGKIVARCTGPSEFGARALGNRSILASPMSREVIQQINDRIKSRDFWMPFTPSILEEFANDYLDNPKEVKSPSMTIGFETNERARQQIPGALHPSDHSARPQFVSRATNQAYWNLIDEFRKLTGVPALLNTSLNLHGDPMNYSESDAARTLALSDLEFLELPGGRVLCKEHAIESLLQVKD